MGNDEKETDFYRVTAWRGLSNVIATHFKKGDPILIMGDIALNEYEGKDGVKRLSAEVSLTDFNFMGGKKDEDKPKQESKPKPRLEPSDEIWGGFTVLRNSQEVFYEQKPELTESEKRLGNSIARLLKERTYTKEELIKIFGISERKIRDIVSEIAKRRPIISISSGKGYKWASNSLDDYKAALRQWQENDSRARQITSRNEPLIKHLEAFMKENNINTLRELNRRLGGLGVRDNFIFSIVVRF